jgi:hypothetical protein
MQCLGDADCQMDCAGGTCNFECSTTGNCQTSCDGGLCSGP